MILAAGRGDRLRPITDTIPKAMVEVGGTSLLEQNLRRLADAGVSTVVINLGWLGEQIAATIGSGKRFGLQVVYSPEYENILDTGGGIRRATADHREGAVLGDQCGHLHRFRAAGHQTRSAKPGPPGARADTSAQVPRRLRTGRRQGGQRGDAAILPTAAWRSTEQSCSTGTDDGRFSVVPLMRAAADRGRLEGSLYEGVWHDVGTPERLAALNEM